MQNFMLISNPLKKLQKTPVKVIDEKVTEKNLVFYFYFCVQVFGL